MSTKNQKPTGHRRKSRRRKQADSATELTGLMLQLFRGREDFVAVETDKGFAPKELDSPLTPKQFEQFHLAGKGCLGFYLINARNQIECSCLDFDSKPQHPDPTVKEKVIAVDRWLTKHGIRPLVERSQSGRGYHVWLFFRSPLPARVVRSFWRALLQCIDIAEPEIYPRQDELTGKGLGNLIRYPLWAKSCFLDVTSGWRVIDPLKALENVEQLSLEDLQRVADELGFELQRPHDRACVIAEVDGSTSVELSPRVQELLAEEQSYLARRWGGDTEGLTDCSRSAIVASIACELVRQYVPTSDITAAISAWCSAQQYEKGDRKAWINSVVEGAYEHVWSQNRGQTHAASARQTRHLRPVLRAAEKKFRTSKR